MLVKFKKEIIFPATFDARERGESTSAQALWNEQRTFHAHLVSTWSTRVAWQACLSLCTAESILVHYPFSNKHSISLLNLFSFSKTVCGDSAARLYCRVKAIMGVKFWSIEQRKNVQDIRREWTTTGRTLTDSIDMNRSLLAIELLNIQFIIDVSPFIFATQLFHSIIHLNYFFSICVKIFYS